jgi:hypothetical protein
LALDAKLHTSTERTFSILLIDTTNHPKMAKEPVERTGIIVGLNKGHVSPAHTSAQLLERLRKHSADLRRKPRPSSASHVSPAPRAT